MNNRKLDLVSPFNPLAKINKKTDEHDLVVAHQQNDSSTSSWNLKVLVYEGNKEGNRGDIGGRVPQPRVFPE